LFSDAGAVIEGVNELAGERDVPSSAEEGWMRDEEETAKPPKYAQTGWCWSNSVIFLQSVLSITFVAGTIDRDSAKGCSKSIGDCISLIHEAEHGSKHPNR
jgi:hypothetical protein